MIDAARRCFDKNVRSVAPRFRPHRVYSWGGTKSWWLFVVVVLVVVKGHFCRQEETPHLINYVDWLYRLHHRRQHISSLFLYTHGVRAQELYALSTSCMIDRAVLLAVGREDEKKTMCNGCLNGAVPDIYPTYTCFRVGFHDFLRRPEDHPLPQAKATDNQEQYR